MLKLTLTIKCGYEKNYITIDNYEIDVSFLAKPEFYERVDSFVIDYDSILPDEAEQALFNKYSDNVEGLLRDFGLGAVLSTTIPAEIALKYFPEVIDEKIAPVVFPELLVLKNYKLLFIESSENEEDKNIITLSKIIEKAKSLDILDQDSELELDSLEIKKFDA